MLKTIKLNINCPEIVEGNCKIPSAVKFDFYLNNKIIFSEFYLNNNSIDYSFETNFDVEKTNIFKLLYTSFGVEIVKNTENKILDINEFIITPNVNYIRDVNSVYDLTITENPSCSCSPDTRVYEKRGLFKKDYFINDKHKVILTEYCMNSTQSENTIFAQEIANLWNHTDKLTFKIIECYRPFNNQEKRGSEDLADKYTLTIKLAIV
jgi:hypothetical protein